MFSQPKIPHATESGNRKQFVLVMHYVIAVIIIITIIIIIAIIIIIIISVPWKLSCTGAIIAIPRFVSRGCKFRVNCSNGDSQRDYFAECISK